MSQGAKYAAVAGLGALAYPLGRAIGLALGRRNDKANTYAFGIK